MARGTGGSGLVCTADVASCEPGGAGVGGGMEMELGSVVTVLEAFCMTGMMGKCSG